MFDLLLVRFGLLLSSFLWELPGSQEPVEPILRMESESLAKESESESGDPLSRLLFVFKVTRNPATLFGNSHTGIRISKLCSAVLRARKLFWASHWHCNFDGTDKVHWQALFHVRSHLLLAPLQHADIGWPTGNGKKLSNSQACCLNQLCLAAA